VNLWVDDCKPVPEGDEWAVARTYDAAVSLLQRFTYDVVALDHDLGDDDAPTGYDILLGMERGELRRPHVELRIISWNVSGVQRMKAAAHAMGIPYTVDIETRYPLRVEACPDIRAAPTGAQEEREP